MATVMVNARVDAQEKEIADQLLAADRRTWSQAIQALAAYISCTNKFSLHHSLRTRCCSDPYSSLAAGMSTPSSDPSFPGSVLPRLCGYCVHSPEEGLTSCRLRQISEKPGF